MHYVQGGNLARPWRIKDQDSWSPIEIAGVLYQCLNALAYLHAETDTIHWRIKPENVLVERRYPRVRGLHVKIGEIGLDESSEVGIWTYTAPEALTGMFIRQEIYPNWHWRPGRKTHPGAVSPIPHPRIIQYVETMNAKMHANLRIL